MASLKGKRRIDPTYSAGSSGHRRNDPSVTGNRRNDSSGNYFVDTPQPRDKSQSNPLSELITNTSIEQLNNSSSVLAKILGGFGGVNGNSDPLMQLLLQLGGTLSNNPLGTFDDDVLQKLLEMYLSQITKNDQRGYDQSALQEQRIYDSPSNQLARLMGAGISRDAAIQMLQGGSEPALVGSGAESGIEPFQQSPSQKVAQVVQTVAGFLGTVGNLVGLGFTIPQAIQQTHYLANANTLTDRQIKAYNSAGKAYSILNAAGAAAESFDSVGSAVSAIQKLANNGDSLASQFVAEGGITDMQRDAPFVSNVMRDMYKSENSSEMFRKEMKRADLQNSLINAEIETEYQNVMDALQRIKESDERVQLYHEQLATQKEITRQEFYAADFADFQGKVLQGLESLTDAQGNSVSSMMSYTQFAHVWEEFRASVARVSDPDKFNKWCQDNWDAFCDLATIQAIANSNYRINLGEDDDPTFMSALLRFARLMDDSGLGSMINNTVQSATGVANSITNMLSPSGRR